MDVHNIYFITHVLCIHDSFTVLLLISLLFLSQEVISNYEIPVVFVINI